MVSGVFSSRVEVSVVGNCLISFVLETLTEIL